MINVCNKNNHLKVYFHIGQAKTGSSAIQSFLNYNREVLAKEHKILYPNFNSNESFEKGFDHNHANYFHKLHKISDKKIKFAEFKDCLEYSIHNGIEIIVFSAEMFEFEWLPIIIKEASELFKFDFSVILYLRRQDHYLEAAWKQWGHKMVNVDSIQVYSKRVHLNWHDTFNTWLKHISPEKFTVKPYEKSSIGEDIIGDFMSLLGIDSLIGFKTPPNNSLNKNNGLNTDVIEILKLCRSAEGSIHNNILLEFVYNSLPEHYKKPPMVSYNILSPRERLKIIEQYTESNNKIASIFFGEGSVLFHDPLPDLGEPWEPYSGLTLEKAIPIIMEILLKLSKDIDQTTQLIQSKKVIYSFCGIDIFNNSIFSKQIVHKQLINNEIHFESRKDDPIIKLPKTNIPINYFTIKIEISVSVDTIIQLFYKTKFISQYIEEKSLKSNIHAGRNIVTFKINERNVYNRLRLDPGCHAGKYIIHKIEFCE